MLKRPRPQLLWALMTFFWLTSTGLMRERLYGQYADSEPVAWFCVVFPFCTALFVAISRVYEGLHYPSDIVLGGLLGVGSAVTYARFLPWMWLNADPGHFTGRVLILELFAGAFLAAVLLCHRQLTEREAQDLQGFLKTACKGKNAHRTIQPRKVPFSECRASEDFSFKVKPWGQRE